jgi:hypothetical protein
MSNFVMYDSHQGLNELDEKLMATINGGESILGGAKGAVGGAAAYAFFRAGYWFGTQLDQEYGLSDKISDWAAENIPWPF